MHIMNPNQIVSNFAISVKVCDELLYKDVCVTLQTFSLERCIPRELEAFRITQL